MHSRNHDDAEAARKSWERALQMIGALRTEPVRGCKKVAILLEELGSPYRIVPVDIGSGDQFAASYLALNPNHRMPVIVDTEPLVGGSPISVFESGAILIRRRKGGPVLAADAAREVRRYAVGVLADGEPGSKSGESGHFRRAAQRLENGDLAYPLRRFDDEVNRPLGVMTNWLYGRRYLGGNEYTIADIASYPWSLSWQALGPSMDDFKYFKRWLEDVGSRPAVQRGLDVGRELAVDFSRLPKEELERQMKILSNQRALRPPADSALGELRG